MIPTFSSNLVHLPLLNYDPLSRSTFSGFPYISGLNRDGSCTELTGSLRSVVNIIYLNLIKLSVIASINLVLHWLAGSGPIRSTENNCDGAVVIMLWNSLFGS